VKKDEIKQGNFTYLLIGLLTFLILAPAIDNWMPESSTIIVQAAFTITILFGVWSMIDDRRWFIFGLILAAISLCFTIVNIFMKSPIIYISDIMVLLLFSTMSLFHAMRQIMFGPRIDTNKIVGSASIYLLIGIIWALLYVVVDHLYVESFNGVIESNNRERFWDYIYFSFVTLTTLGFGDITPVNQPARTLAYMEAIVGQLYLTILVASLVGAHLSEIRQNKN